jgi:membrane fusion protein (multidrug efflux system)
MSKRLKLVIVAIAILAIGLAGFMYWKNVQRQAAKARGFPPAVIAASEVTQEYWEPSLTAVGSLVAINGIDVSSEVNGIVSKIVFTSGQAVQQDQVLINLENSVDLAALEALQAERKLFEVKLVRARGLLKKRVMSQSEFDEIEASFEAANARVKQQRAVIKRKAIRAPFAGLAGIRQVDLGQYLEAGKAIVSLQTLDPIYVDYSLPERYLSRIKSGQVVHITLDAIAGQTFSGEVIATNSGIDTGTRTLKVRATLKNPGAVMRPGMFAEVQTITGEAQPVLTVPRTAISYNTYGDFVFVINQSEQGMSVKRTAVKTGDVREGRVVVTNLPAGTQLVRAGLVKLRDGAPVKIDNQVKLNDKEISGE